MNNNKTVLGFDGGFGHCKVTLGTADGTILQQFKFSSVIGITQRNEHINDNRIYDFKGHSYYVGENAMHLPSENLVDITEYKNLEYYIPVFLYHALQQLDVMPDIIVSGLSKAQIENSGHFKQAISNFEINNKQFKFDEVYILPQGAGSKLCNDKYGNNFPHEQTEFTGKSTYVGIDVGMNTVDTYLVTDGKTSPNLFEGIEHEGVMKIATLVAKKVKELHGRNITLQEAKDIIDTGFYKLRGQKYAFTEYVDEVKRSYLKGLLELIEVKYGKILDKVDNIFLSGGGSAIFKQTEDGFIKVPKSHPEFYNSVGFKIFGDLQANKPK